MSQQNDIAKLNVSLVENDQVVDQPKAPQDEFVDAFQKEVLSLEENYGHLRPLIRDELIKTLQDTAFLTQVFRNMMLGGIKAIDYQRQHAEDMARPVVVQSYSEGALVAKLAVVEGVMTAKIYETTPKEGGYEVGAELEADTRYELLKQMVLGVNLEPGLDTLFITTAGRILLLRERAAQVVNEMVGQA